MLPVKSTNHKSLTESRAMTPPGISTALTSLLGVRHPIINAPMCGMAMGKLAGSVAAAGGVGIIGIGAARIFGPERVRSEYQLARQEIGAVEGVFGFGFLEAFMDDDGDDTFDACMALSPSVIWLSGYTLSRSDTPEKWIRRARELCADVKIMVQVFTVEGAVEAASLGANAVILQGCDAGGHGRQSLGTSIVSLVPQTRIALEEAGLSSGCAVIAAGGIATGRQMAASLLLGADGVVMGTAFAVTKESVANDSFKERILDTKDGTSCTMCSDAWDHLSSMGGPFLSGGLTGRALSDSETIRRFRGKNPIEVTAADKEWYAKSNYTTRAVWCSTSSGLLNAPQITSGELVTKTIEEAMHALRGEYSHFQCH